MAALRLVRHEGVMLSRTVGESMGVLDGKLRSSTVQR